MSRIILCVDMDAFFTSVEQQSNRTLRNKPIAVTGAGPRTVITTSSYEARAYGVETGMTVYEAKRLCPQITFLTRQLKKETLAKAVDTINDKFEEHTITLASTIAREEGPGVISPAWRPTGVRKGNV